MWWKWNDLTDRVKKLELEVWELKNPPKYKIGQKVKYKCYYEDRYQRTGIIVDRYRRKYLGFDLLWWYEIFSDSTQLKTRIKESDIKNS